MDTGERTAMQLQALEARLEAIGEQMALLIRIEVTIAIVIVAWGVASLVLLVAWLAG